MWEDKRVRESAWFIDFQASRNHPFKIQKESVWSHYLSRSDFFLSKKDNIPTISTVEDIPQTRYVVELRYSLLSEEAWVPKITVNCGA